MLLKHHEKTQELEYRQQKSVHQLREEQVGLFGFPYSIYPQPLTSFHSLWQINKQHDTELHNQKDYMDRIKKELVRKHALELRQQPKSLKVRSLSLWS